MELRNPPAKRLLLHGHCHQKALVGTQMAMEVLRAIPDCEVSEIPSGCCGMAGSFGFEKTHYDVSMSIGEQVLFPAIRSEAGDTVVVSEGISCRQQIEHGTGKRAKHLVEVLADALELGWICAWAPWTQPYTARQNRRVDQGHLNQRGMSQPLARRCRSR